MAGGGGYFESIVDDDALDESVSTFLDDINESESSENVDEVDIDERYAHVEARLEIVALYRALLKEPLFSEETEATAIVEKRMRAFAKADMMNMLGMAQPQHKKSLAAALFTEEDVTALKKLASKLNAGAAAKLAAPEPEAIKTVAREPAPAPTLRKVGPASSTVRTQVDKPPSPKKKSAKGGEEIIDSVGTEHKGETVVTKRKGGRLVRVYERNGREVAKNDITPPKASKKSVPQPSKEQLQVISEQHAAMNVAANKAMQTIAPVAMAATK